MEQDPERVHRWLEEEYPAIRAQARKAGAEIYFGDEAPHVLSHTGHPVRNYLIPPYVFLLMMIDNVAPKIRIMEDAIT